MYGTDDWGGAKFVDLLTASLKAITYLLKLGKIRTFAEFCIDAQPLSSCRHEAGGYSNPPAQYKRGASARLSVLRRVITDILDDLAAPPTTTTDYGNILRDGGAAVCPTFMLYSRALLRRFLTYRDAAFRARPFAKQPCQLGLSGVAACGASLDHATTWEPYGDLFK
eukprot:jgi/Tetstr1/454317/TSEL_041236.t1